VGTAVGGALGLLTIDNINLIRDFLSHVFGVELFPSDIYNFTQIPAHLDLRDLIVIGASAIVICTLGGVLPAWWASRLEPVEALRS
jgi:lipoprotein-releasing system permease protein